MLLLLPDKEHTSLSAALTFPNHLDGSAPDVDSLGDHFSMDLDAASTISCEELEFSSGSSSSIVNLPAGAVSTLSSVVAGQQANVVCVQKNENSKPKKTQRSRGA